MKLLHLMAAGSVLCLCSGAARAALISHYTFDELTGTTAVDSGSAGVNGTIGTNVTLGTPGVFGTAFTFKNDAAQAGVVDMGDATAVFAAINTSQTLTISLWVNWTGAGVRDSIVFLGDNTATNRYLDVGTVTATNGFYGRVRNGVNSGYPDITPTPTTGLNNGQWQHIAYTVDAAADITQLYVNGVLVGSTATAVTLPSIFNNFEVGRLGRSAPTDAFAGSIDELRIYDTVLSGQDIAALAVPEPSFSMLLLGSAGLLLRRQRGARR
ncbi:MAG: LamG domain-containing protein [Verrucomicrobiaceae bacterium]|nr:MAG: LamG domain-containing protein [Verrucomicrobiaceae bacterium]